MVKRLMTIMLAGMISLPVTSLANASSIEELEERIDELEETIEAIDENSEKWDLASRIQWNGDFRFSAYWNEADTQAHWYAKNASDPWIMFLAAGETMKRYLHNNGDDPNLTLNDMMVDFNNDKLNPDGNPLTQMTDTEFDTYDQVMNSGQSLDVLKRRFPLPLSDQVAIFQNMQNAANFFVGTYYISPLGADDPNGTGLTRQERINILNELGFYKTEAAKYKNDSILLNRFRLNLRTKATENVEIKARFVVYKAWGMQNNPIDLYNDPDPMASDELKSDNYGPYLYSTMDFDGNNTRVPGDNKLKVDRMFANWNNVFDMPIWFSAGRRPTTDGPPAQFKLGADKRMATPLAFMDYPFDGMTFGIAWSDPWPGRGRFCMGRGFESGSTVNGKGVNDVDFAGFAFDLYKKNNAFLYLQSFGAFNMMNVPDNVMFWNPAEVSKQDYNDKAIANGDPITFIDDPNTPEDEGPGNGILDRANLGNIYHTDFVFYNTTGNWDYFFTGGWSRTDPKGYDELGVGLLSIWWDPNMLEEKDGFAVYTGTRYNIENLGLKVGAEFNWGSKNWISFTPGHDDLYASKLAVRGWATEVYGIWNFPSGEAISKFGKAFIRFGWIHYNYEYTGSGFWLGEPNDIDDLDDPANAQFNAPVKTSDSVYLTYEAWF